MEPCIMCMQPGGDPLSGGYCAACRPLDVSIARGRLGPAALTAKDIAMAFGTKEKK
jgi:hypothetical protein